MWENCWIIFAHSINEPTPLILRWPCLIKTRTVCHEKWRNVYFGVGTVLVFCWMWLYLLDKSVKGNFALEYLKLKVFLHIKINFKNKFLRGRTKHLQIQSRKCVPAARKDLAKAQNMKSPNFPNHPTRLSQIFMCHNFYQNKQWKLVQKLLDMVLKMFPKVTPTLQWWWNAVVFFNLIGR